MQKLCASNLTETNGCDVTGVAAKGLVHLFINTLRLERCLIEMCFTQHGPFACRTFLCPTRPVTQLAGGFPLGRHIKQLLQSFASI